MESRTKDLYVMHNNILSECDKVEKYLQNIKEKSEAAISFLVHLSNSNLLRNYSSTYEYLNKFYLKLLDQNCAFELFFLELDTPTAILDKLSLLTRSSNISIKDAIACSECSLDNVTLSTSKISDDSLERNIFQTCFERSMSRCSNLINQELQLIDLCEPQKTHTIDNNSSTENNQEVVSCISTDLCKDDPEVSQEIKSEILSDVTTLYEKNASENNIVIANKELDTNLNQNEPSQSFQLIASNHRCEIDDMPVIDNISTSSGQITDSESIKHESVSEYSEENMKMSEKVNKDLKIALKNVEQRFKGKISKRSMAVPDLRPVVKKNVCNEEITIYSTKDTGNSTVEENQIVRRKKVQKENEVDNASAIVLKRSTTPNIGDLCYVSYVESPLSFYIQVIREENTLIDYLSDQITEIATSLKTYQSKLDAFKAIDKYCVCYIEEFSAWYRAIIVEWLLDNDENVLVRLIDHGMTRSVPLKYIRDGISYFFLLPIMAEKCELAWIKPPNNLNDWPKDSFGYFYDIVNPQANRLFTISFIEKVEDTLIIDLETNDMDSLVESMLEAGKADKNIPGVTEINFDQFMKTQILKSQGLDQYSNMSKEEKLEKAFELDDEEVDDPNIAVSHYNAKDEAEVCRIFLKHGKCFKGNTCRFSHRPLNPDGWTTDKETVYYHAFNQLQLPSYGEHITVKIIHIVNVRTFYIVLRNVLYPKKLLPFSINNIKALVKSMNSPEEIRTYEIPIVIPALSQIMLVKHTNNLWQRGRVVDVNEYANRVELNVFLVDFGSVVKVNMKDTRYIKEQHLHLPFQAVMCTLANVILKPNMSDEEHDMACNYLEMNVLFKKLKAKVISRFDCLLSVLLYNEAGQDVGQELIKSEIVRECEQFFTPKEDFLID